MAVNSRSQHHSGGLSPITDRVLFIDGEAIILDKPAGLPVDPPRDGSLSLHNHLASLTFGFERWPVAVHRLDRDTSGCLLLARNPKAAKRFTEAFEARAVEKSYLAVVDGVPDAPEGVIDLPLAKRSTAATGWRMVPDAAGKQAVTHWRLLAARDGRALLRFTPETGRTHQLRAHSLHGLGFGILGDPVYSSGADPLWTGGLLLHARSLSMPRPGKAPAAAIAPVPPRFAQAGFPDAEALDSSDV
ncbi:RluA family pseudouridine synthase [Sphingobium lignivorans]|uniref:tRNA pseudouridine32 synthase/23S rRNA pseudouridine746 synthase n=1 Tax=Sphingobium lignivorans TaxID=2735886 RepID=A0ABR6NM06_9SPHN|nr:RNA pseudouridine synthase [Sphingobium lignivorans]MBB5987234.1 tRNA pseudouridine32 synthase/23S rRNA pseudouridine746 synthase [Sphingobium lignivorans]